MHNNYRTYSKYGRLIGGILGGVFGGVFGGLIEELIEGLLLAQRLFYGRAETLKLRSTCTCQGGDSGQKRELRATRQRRILVYGTCQQRGNQAAVFGPSEH